MPYTIVYTPQAKRDLLKIPRDQLGMIRRAIEERLMVDPFAQAKPLKHNLKGFWKQRVGHWRIIFDVEGRIVSVQKIRLRRDAYKD